MPELPEVETIVRNLRPVILGHTIAGLKFFRGDLRRPIPIDDLQRNLTNQTVLSVSRRSKYIIIETTGGSAILHLGMTGNVLVRESDQPELPHTHFIIKHRGNGSLESGNLHYVDPRRFGSLGYSPFGAPMGDSKEFVNLGPEPLQEDFDLGTYLWKTSRKRSVAVKTFLMDASVLVGVGNIYASEALFKSRILPTRRASQISLVAFQKIAAAIRSTLNAAIIAGGTTIRDFQNTDGKPGYFRIELAVYDRAGEPCRTCSSPVKSIRQTGRSTFFCQKCQK